MSKYVVITEQGELLPAENLALTVALAQVLRGEDPAPNTAMFCVLALGRITGRHDWREDDTTVEEPLCPQCGSRDRTVVPARFRSHGSFCDDPWHQAEPVPAAEPPTDDEIEIAYCRSDDVAKWKPQGWAVVDRDLVRLARLRAVPSVSDEGEQP